VRHRVRSNTGVGVGDAETVGVATTVGAAVTTGVLDAGTGDGIGAGGFVPQAIADTTRKAKNNRFITTLLVLPRCRQPFVQRQNRRRLFYLVRRR
jgi:hypothetical protein